MSNNNLDSDIPVEFFAVRYLNLDSNNFGVSIPWSSAEFGKDGYIEEL